MHAGAIFDGLNAEQRRAVAAIRGPVVILAGAGSGKTTTLTRRIANQVASGVRPQSILAVTFTDKAARELAARLASLGVTGVRASTFHSAALQQLHAFGSPPGNVLPSKVQLLAPLARSLPGGYRFRAVSDLANEIEWAKNRRISPARYRASLGDHEPPIPADLMAGLYRRYEEIKRRRGFIDFEDLLELAIRLLEDDDAARERLHERSSVFSVDEFQDVNLLQQTLLDRWLGQRDDVCVVGDDYQSIYGFTGASPSFLLRMGRRFPHATIVRLEENHRSTPQVLGVANRLVPSLGGVQKVLRAVRPPGPEPRFDAFIDPAAERNSIVERVTALHRDGVPLEETAILYRVNFRSEEFEESLAAAGIPFQVRAGAFLRREGPRRLIGRLRRPDSRDVAADVRRAASALGMLETLPEDLGEQEATRQRDLARMVQMAEEFDDGTRTVAAFVDDLRERFEPAGSGRGVHLLTYHSAKGLEFQAVFLPRLEEGELPYRRSTTGEALAEERRLLYVGITRAKRLLFVSWTRSSGKPSRFLRELGADAAPPRPPPRPRDRGAVPVPDGPLDAALREWRRRRAASDGVPAFVVFHDRTLHEIGRRRPHDRAGLAGITGVGPVKLERYGEEILEVIRASTP